MATMRRVIIETPFRGDPLAPDLPVRRAINLNYARDCGHECMRRGDAPFGSHLIYPQMLDDDVPEERQLGMEAGFAWVAVAEASLVYVDRGISGGMRAGVAAARDPSRFGFMPVEIRRLGVAEPLFVVKGNDSDDLMQRALAAVVDVPIEGLPPEGARELEAANFEALKHERAREWLRWQQERQWCCVCRARATFQSLHDHLLWCARHKRPGALGRDLGEPGTGER